MLMESQAHLPLLAGPFLTMPYSMDLDMQLAGISQLSSRSNVSCISLERLLFDGCHQGVSWSHHTNVTLTWQLNLRASMLTSEASMWPIFNKASPNVDAGSQHFDSRGPYKRSLKRISTGLAMIVLIRPVSAIAKWIDRFSQ